MSAFKLWLIVKAIPALSCVLGILALVLIVCLLFNLGTIAFLVADEYDSGEPQKNKNHVRKAKKSAIIAAVLSIVFFMLCALVPNREETIAIWGVAEITSVEGADELPEKLVDYLSEELETDGE